MDARVEAGPLTLAVSAAVVEPILFTQLNMPYVSRLPLQTTWTCFFSSPKSINGHSLSAVNPDLAVLGGKATLIMA